MVRARIGHKRYTGTTTEFPPNYECEGMMGDSFEASKKRSDEIRADLSVNPGKYCMLTAIAPRVGCIWAITSALSASVWRCRTWASPPA